MFRTIRPVYEQIISDGVSAEADQPVRHVNRIFTSDLNLHLREFLA